MSTTFSRFGATHLSRPPGSRVWARVDAGTASKAGAANANAAPLASRASSQGAPAQRLGRLPPPRDAALPVSFDGRGGVTHSALQPAEATLHASSGSTAPLPLTAAAVLVQHGDRLWGVRPPPVPRPNAGRSGAAAWTAGLPPVRGLAQKSGARSVTIGLAPPGSGECQLVGRHGDHALSVTIDFDDLRSYVRREPNRRYHNLPAYLHALQTRAKAGQPAPVALGLSGTQAGVQSLDIAQLQVPRDAQARFNALANRALAMEGRPVVQPLS